MKDNLIIASKLLTDFNNFLDKRSTMFLTRIDGMLDSLLQWHFGVWKKENIYLGQDNKLDEWSMYSELSRTTDAIFRQVETRVLKDKASFLFFKKLEKHAETYKKESVSSRYYVESLFDTFYQVYFQNIYDSPERFNIWNHYFPKKWMVTKSNLESSENVISNISLNNFFEWANGRIWQTSEEKDFPLNDVMTNLFPEVDPIAWANILIFIFTPPGDDRLRAVIESPWNFGFMGRVKVFRGPGEDEIRRLRKDEETNTFDLSCFLFKEQFTKTNLESYIQSLEQLSYPKESKEESKKLRLHRLFTRMLDFVKNNEASDLSQSK